MLAKNSGVASAIVIGFILSFVIAPSTNVFAQQLNNPNSPPLPLPPQAQQFNPNVRDHRQQPSQSQDRIETGREPSLLPSAQTPTPQVAVAPR